MQMLHIFRKDVRGLVREVCVFLAVVILWSGTAVSGREDMSLEVLEALVFVGACYLIARVFHADGAAGDREVWKTRPYRWKSLAVAYALRDFEFSDVRLLEDSKTRLGANVWGRVVP
jgi:hypothetical protein